MTGYQSANTRKYLVDDTQGCASVWEHNSRFGPLIRLGPFAAATLTYRHVRTGDDQDLLRGIVQEYVVGNIVLAQRKLLFDNRMPASFDGSVDSLMTGRA